MSIFSAAFTITPNPALVNQSIKFDASPSMGDIVQYKWYFGDGTGLSTGKIITHSFTVPDTYLVTLTITAASGAISDISHEMLVSTAPPSRGISWL